MSFHGNWATTTTSIESQRGQQISTLFALRGMQKHIKIYNQYHMNFFNLNPKSLLSDDGLPVCIALVEDGARRHIFIFIYLFTFT